MTSAGGPGDGPPRPRGTARAEEGEGRVLGQVADLGFVLAGAIPEHGQRASRQREKAEHGFDERRLTGAVRAQDGDELAAADGEVEALPHGAAAEHDRRAARLDGSL